LQAKKELHAHCILAISLNRLPGASQSTEWYPFPFLQAAGIPHGSLVAESGVTMKRIVMTLGLAMTMGISRMHKT
jgi:hypothetical protein